MNKFNVIRIFSLLITLCLLSGCAAYQPRGYSNLSQNVPLLKQKYDLESMFTFGLGHIEEQVAFSPFKQITILGNFYQNIDKTKGRTIEFGGGFYKLFEDWNEIEIFGLYTNSRNSSSFTQNTLLTPLGGELETRHNFKANYTGGYLQFNIGKHFQKSQIALTLRYSLLNYPDFYDHKVVYENPLSGYTTLLTDTLTTLNHKFQSILIFGPTYKTGGKHFKYMAQIGIHLDLTTKESNLETPPYFNPFIFTNALVINIGGWR